MSRLINRQTAVYLAGLGKSWDYPAQDSAALMLKPACCRDHAGPCEVEVQLGQPGQPAPPQPALSAGSSSDCGLEQSGGREAALSALNPGAARGGLGSLAA